MSCCLPQPLKLWDFSHSHYIQFTGQVNRGDRSTSAVSNDRRRVSQISYKIIMGQHLGDKVPHIMPLIDSWKLFYCIYFQLATASKLIFLHVYFDMWPLGFLCSIKNVFLKKHFRLFSFLSISSTFSFSYIQNKTTHCHASNYFLFATTWFHTVLLNNDIK